MTHKPYETPKFCLVCGKVLEVNHNNITVCSEECRKRFYNATKIRKNYPEKCCVFCGKKFKPYIPHSIFCSNNCRKKDGLIKYYIKKNKTFENKKCVICNLDFITTNKQQKYCSDCRHKKRYNNIRLNGKEWQILSEYIYERDGYKCKECSSDKNIVAHHIKFKCDGGSDDETNLITLCAVCHGKKHNQSENFRFTHRSVQ